MQTVLRLNCSIIVHAREVIRYALHRCGRRLFTLAPSVVRALFAAILKNSLQTTWNPPMRYFHSTSARRISVQPRYATKVSRAKSNYRDCTCGVKYNMTNDTSVSNTPV